MFCTTCCSDRQQSTAQRVQAPGRHRKLIVCLLSSENYHLPASAHRGQWKELSGAGREGLCGCCWGRSSSSPTQSSSLRFSIPSCIAPLSSCVSFVKQEWQWKKLSTLRMTVLLLLQSLTCYHTAAASPNDVFCPFPYDCCRQDIILPEPQVVEGGNTSVSLPIETQIAASIAFKSNTCF